MQTTTQSATDLWRAAFQQVETLEPRSPAEREQHIAAIERENAELARKVKLLLGEITEDNASFTKVAEHTRAHATNDFKEGATIGAYTLIRSIGQGGMADVWLARRTDGELKRPVAIKLPMAVLPSNVLAERFRRERDILSQLDHPHIAKLFDAGTTSDAQPYMVLEYIDGDSLTKYCTAKRLNIEGRVRLIVDAARAVHHAHSRLVLHRDLKPSNMLVTNDGQLKVLDFGIAKLLADDRSAEETQFTKMTGAAMTPKYAAPEQLVGQTVTTSTDVYALAVVAFELLAGQFPFATHNAIDLAERLKCANTPCKSLAEVTIPAAQIAALGNPSARSVQRALKGDLQFILAKALRHASADRYDSALAFADDLERYLTDKPVQARQGARWYRFTKFVTRHRLPLGIAMAGTLAAAALGVNTIVQTQRAGQAQARADSIDSLMESLFQGMSPDVARSRTFTAKELLDRASQQLQSATDRDGVSPALHERIGNLYRDIGDYDGAIKAHEQQHSAAKTRGDRRQEVLALWSLADNESRKERLDEAKGWLAKAELVAASISKPDVLHGRIAILRGQIAWLDKKFDESVLAYTEGVAHVRATEPSNVELLVWGIEGRGQTERARGHLDAAQKDYDEVAALDSRFPTRGAIDRLRSQSVRGTLSNAAGRFAHAHDLLGSVCNELAKRLGPKHDETISICQAFAFSAMRIGNGDEAKQVLTTVRASIPADDAALQRGHAQFDATWQMYFGDPAMGERSLRELIAEREKRGTLHTDSSYRLTRQLGELLLRNNRTDEALQSLSSTLEGQLRLRGEAHPDPATTRVLLGLCYLRTGKRQLASETLSKSVTVLVKERGEAHPSTLSAQTYLALANEATDIAINRALATRIKNELGWQSGAKPLINTLNALTKHGIDWVNLPVVL